MHKCTWFVLLLLGIAGCKPVEKPVTHDFYYWKSKFEVDSVEQNYLSLMGSKNIYVRLFDVDQSDRGFPQPVGNLQGLDPSVVRQNLIPVVYITNRSFNGMSIAAVDTLAKRVYTRVSRMFTQAGINKIPEIQIDCDWTQGTRNVFFTFLESLKKYSGTGITCTLRLHQVKFKTSTGVPPVDKVYLMCYATSSPLEKDPRNSILDIALLADYLQDINAYPLDFDLALPLYSWAIVRNHLGEVRLINGVSAQELQAPQYQLQADGKYRVEQDVFLKGLYLNKGFSVKVESISPELLQEVQAYLKSHVQANYKLVYFHLDAQFLSRFAIPELKY